MRKTTSIPAVMNYRGLIINFFFYYNNNYYQANYYKKKKLFIIIIISLVLIITDTNSGSQTVETEFSQAVESRPRGSPGGTTRLRSSSRNKPRRSGEKLCRSPIAVTSSKIFF
jgi:hypothetical protein